MPKFSKAALVKLVNEDADQEVAQHLKAIEELEAQRPHDEAMAEWRAEVEKKIRETAEALPGLTDQHLMMFRLPQPPEDKARYIEHNKSYITRIEQRRKSVIDIIGALVADKEGNISLSISDLRGLGLQGRY